MFLSGGAVPLPVSPALTGVLRLARVCRGHTVRVGESILEKKAVANRHPSATVIPDNGDRPVTEGSRLVTATILLVNAAVRKHGIPVSCGQRTAYASGEHQLSG